MTFEELMKWTENAVHEYKSKYTLELCDISYYIDDPSDKSGFWINLNYNGTLADRGGFAISKVDEYLSDIIYSYKSSELLSGVHITFEIKRGIPNENVQKFIESLLVKGKR